VIKVSSKTLYGSSLRPSRPFPKGLFSHLSNGECNRYFTFSLCKPLASHAFADLCCTCLSGGRRPRCQGECVPYIHHACVCHGYLKKRSEEDSSCLVDFLQGKRGKRRWSLEFVQKMTVFHLDSVPSLLCPEKSTSITCVRVKTFQVR